MSDSAKKRAAISGRLAMARKMAGLSQAQVAKLLNLHRPTISELEAGRRGVSVEELTKLAEIYGVGLSWLACTDTDSPNPVKDRLELAARQLSKLKKADLDRVIELLTAIGVSRESE
jgi:transcriptional regulator with XRE-family HTH domain